MQKSMLALAGVVIVAASAPAQTFNVGANFQTTSIGESGFEPPDTQGAAGQNHIVVLVNGRYKSFTKIGTQTQSLTDTAFFTAAGYTGGANQNVAGDPRLRFDPLTGRWFAVNFTDGDASGLNNRLVIAVSANADPTGQWKSVTIQHTGGTFGDFPTLGMDANGIYLATNNFIGNSFQNVSIWTAAKSGLLWTGSGSPTLNNLTAFEGLSAGGPDNRGITINATNNFDPNQSGNTNRIVAGFNPTTLRTYNIQNTGGTTTLGSGTFLTVNTMNFPPDAPQQGTSHLIATGDNRISGAMVQVGNFIYATNAFDNGTGRSQVRWTIFDAGTGAVVSQGDINDPVLNYYYPSIAVNELGQAVIGFSGSSNGTFVNTYAAVSLSGLGSLSFGAPTLISSGTSQYGFNRWGDYSATNVDPADTGIFWTFQERAGTNPGEWLTDASEIIPTIAGQARWKNAANGNYSSAANWFAGAAPSASDHVIYSRNGAPFTVTLPSAVTTANDRISVRQGTMTFSIPGGATYQATNASASTPSFAVSQMLGDSTVTIQGGGAFNTVYTTLAAGENGLVTDNISKAVVNVTGAGTTWTNSRDVYFGGSATRSGGTATLNINPGATVTIGEVARFWTSTSGVTVNASTLNVGGLRADSGVVPTITGVSGGTLRITDGLGQTYFGAINGNLAIIKNGTGTQTLSGPMSYAGTTDINAGRLNINGAKSGTANVNVNNGGTLGGTGIVGGMVNVSNGAKIAPGLSPGNLTLSGGITMNAGTYEWELSALTTAGAGTNYDEITITGGASLIGGTSQVQLVFNGTAVSPNSFDPFWTTPHQWLITDLVSGALTGIYSGITNPNYTFGNFFLSGGNGDIFLNYQFAPVPEPDSLALVGAALAGLVFWRRRRKAA